MGTPVSRDITSILAGWDFVPGELQVRIVAGDDGQEKLQIRLDLGLMQLELAGRPDGQRPDGHESLLDRLEQEAARLAGLGEALSLSSAECAELMREGVQYYHRYLALYHLERYDLVARDTERNLRLFQFVVTHASNPRDRFQFDQYRPYVTMMRTRALGFRALQRGDYRGALQTIDSGIEAIRAFLEEYQQTDNEAQCRELIDLREWRREVMRNRPGRPLDRLEEQLALAIAREDYEEAAQLRDQIRRLREATGLGTDPDATPEPGS